jgi:hypothetical protein
MTELANSPVFWIGLLASLELLPIAWPVALVVAFMMPRKETWSAGRACARGIRHGHASY